MTLKSIELQIAVPRTSEATSVQNHLNHKPTYDQAALAEASAKLADKKRTKSTEVDSSAFLDIKKDGKSSHEPRSSLGKRKQAEEEPNRLGSTETGHPYKGKHIDISL